jgi:LmbE family N-acetylglucosaminyl deacetylase
MTLNAPYSGAQVLDDISKLIADFEPTVVYTTHPDDTHPDHWAAYLTLWLLWKSCAYNRVLGRGPGAQNC